MSGLEGRKWGKPAKFSAVAATPTLPLRPGDQRELEKASACARGGDSMSEGKAAMKMASSHQSLHKWCVPYQGFAIFL